ncbi:MAG: hypothetical protein MK137_06665, partial [Rickettsiales bacterium]|nr:hypothetical protein [Rickettsiales bacterium]
VDKEIVLWPDNDDVGVHFMALMTLALKRLGAKNIKLIQWSEGPFRGDAANFSGNKTKLMALIKSAKPWDGRLLKKASKPLHFKFPASPETLRIER